MCKKIVDCRCKQARNPNLRALTRRRSDFSHTMGGADPDWGVVEQLGGMEMHMIVQLSFCADFRPAGKNRPGQGVRLAPSMCSPNDAKYLDRSMPVGRPDLDGSRLGIAMRAGLHAQSRWRLGERRHGLPCAIHGLGRMRPRLLARVRPAASVNSGLNNAASAGAASLDRGS